MGGDISVMSEYGRGSGFTAVLVQSVVDWQPMGDLAAASAARVETQRVAFTAPEAEVLVVDDFPSNLLVAEGLLAPYKIRVFTSLNGRDAVAMVQARSFDLVLMDHMMPEMDGMEATAAIRALGGRFTALPIVALTANVVAGMKEVFLENGFDDFLAKPIETPMLHAVLAQWIPPEKQRKAPEDIGGGAPEEGALPEIPGVDLAAGMARIGGSPGRYRELLQVFRLEAQARFALLEASPDKEDLRAFTTFVHALKSGLANIGANALSGSAAALEQAGRAGDMDVIRDTLAPFREELAALIARLGAATAAARPGATGEENVQAGLPAVLADLRAALSARDADGADTALAKLQSFPLTLATRAAVVGIAQHVLFGDFKKAMEAVDAVFTLE
jgi:CheY-like chemotaxis protein/HPt (histidine-containing phosphotransfer) domain-containing protein